MVSESLARAFWPGESAIGKRLRLLDQATWIEVFGVVGDVKMALNFDRPNSLQQLYHPLTQVPSNLLSFCFKTPLPPAALDFSIRKTIAGVDPDIVVQPTDYFRRAIEKQLAGNDLALTVVGAFAFVGLLLALLGLYGVVAQLTLQRTREIGIRIALGAGQRAVVRMILSHGGRMIVSGVILGVGGAWLVDRIYGSMFPDLPLPGLDAKLALGVILALAGLGACWLPARRAAKVDPVVALRAE